MNREWRSETLGTMNDMRVVGDPKARITDHLLYCLRCERKLLLNQYFPASKGASWLSLLKRAMEPWTSGEK